MGVESAPQPLDCEPLLYATANSKDGACLDVVARDFWSRIGRMHSLMFGCFTLLCAPILTFHYPNVIVSIRRRNVEHMMNGFERWK